MNISYAARQATLHSEPYFFAEELEVFIEQTDLKGNVTVGEHLCKMAKFSEFQPRDRSNILRPSFISTANTPRRLVLNESKRTAEVDLKDDVMHLLTVRLHHRAHGYLSDVKALVVVRQPVKCNSIIIELQSPAAFFPVRLVLEHNRGPRRQRRVRGRRDSRGMSRGNAIDVDGDQQLEPRRQRPRLGLVESAPASGPRLRNQSPEDEPLPLPLDICTHGGAWETCTHCRKMAELFGMP